MRISDWSSDVCSSDLSVTLSSRSARPTARKQKAAAHPTSAHPPSHIKKAAESPVSAQTIPGTQAMTVSIRRREVAIPLLFFSADRRRFGSPMQRRRIGTAERAMAVRIVRSEEHTSELQSLMRISYAVFCLKKKHKIRNRPLHDTARCTDHKN